MFCREVAQFIARAENPDPYDIEDVADVLEGLMQMPVGGLDFDEVETDDLDEPVEQRDMEILNALLGTWRLLSARGSIQQLGTPGTIYVTKRRPHATRHIGDWAPFDVGDLNWHAALNYVPYSFGPTAVTPIRVIAAYKDDLKLVSLWNNPVELNNQIVGALESPVYSTALSLWAALINSDTGYDDELPYAWEPSPPPGKYNSNGFAVGIIESVFAEIVGGGSISGFYLADKPVPLGEFQ